MADIGLIPGVELRLSLRGQWLPAAAHDPTRGLLGQAGLPAARRRRSRRQRLVAGEQDAHHVFSTALTVIA